MATLTVQNVSLDGLAFTTASAGASGDVFNNPNDERTFFYVSNGSGGSINVTFTAQGTSVNASGYGTVDISDTVVAIANGAAEMVGPFPSSRFNNSSGNVAVSYSDNTSVTVAAIRLPK